MVILDEFDPTLQSYSKPRLIKNGVMSVIEGYNDNHHTGIHKNIDIAISQNEQYLKMDSIAKGWVEMPEKKHDLHEKYSCVIVDINAAKVVWAGLDQCGGKWLNNKWVDGSVIIFDANE